VKTVERGLDPRLFSLVAFGGAGPLHAAEIAVELEIPEVVIPEHPGVTSAQGLLFADVIHDYAVSMVRPARELDFDEVESAFRLLEERGRAALSADGFHVSAQNLERFLDLRYLGQAKALSLAIPNDRLNEPAMGELTRGFYEDYERQYQYVTHDIPLELAVLRLRAVGTLARPTVRRSASSRNRAQQARREVYFDGERVSALVVERRSLSDRDRIEGPALVEQPDTTTVLPPGCFARIDAGGNLIINVAERIRQVTRAAPRATVACQDEIPGRAFSGDEQLIVGSRPVGGDSRRQGG
jgi:N-methylhydantoinase A